MTQLSALPAFVPPGDLRPGMYGTRQSDIDRSQEFRKCIECWLCQDVCHVIRDHEQNKPRLRRAALLYPARRAGHAPLDTGDRREALRGQHGLGLCNITKCCSEVCPAGIKITDNAIIPMKGAGRG
jgi:succinate dehydrogenase / fumarate reductase iron-sulfur subunit